MMEVSDGARQAQGRPGQEGQEKVGLMDQPVILCEICKKPEIEHSGVRHLFTPPGMPVDTSQFARKRPNQVMQANTPGVMPEMRMTTLSVPFDPVLRQALINKGIITPDDLMEAERMIAVLTAQVTGGGGQ
jgi:hypothetical protein